MNKLGNQLQTIFTGDLSMDWMIPPGKIKLLTHYLLSPQAHKKAKIPEGRSSTARLYHSQRIQTETVFGNIRDELKKSDIVTINLENPLTLRQQPYFEKRYNLRSDPIIAHFLKRENITHACLANNHILDYGPNGLTDTVVALETVGINHLGISDQKSHIKALLYEMKGTRLALYNLVAPELLAIKSNDLSGTGPRWLQIQKDNSEKRLFGDRYSALGN